MKQLILIGDFHEVRELATRVGEVVSGVVDQNTSIKIKEGEKIWRSDDEFLQIASGKRVFITPDNPINRKALFSRYTSEGAKVVSLCCPSAIISSSATLGDFHCIQNNAHLSSNVKIGKGVKVNTFANIMHDCDIADFVTIAPNAVLLGNVSVGEQSYIGANATILPGIKIGAGVVVGAGSVVTKDVADNIVVCGNPAKVIYEH
jgi:sugar O-acyltransferase (sialic acid O-acetyltransferase NeuD family)